MPYNIPSISINSSVVAVSLNQASYYFQNEIEHEGPFKTNPLTVIVLPESETGIANQYWTQAMLNIQQETREYSEPELIQLSDGTFFDVGLLDIQVFFDGENGPIKALLKKQPDFFLKENLKHIEDVYGILFHDQMIVSTTLHTKRTDGEFQLHYHNIIYSLRKEKERIETLPMVQLINHSSIDISTLHFIR
ncbi:hypothetical protein GCM10007938_42730 [Vibrio zhanjiangensis]|uniref:Uncharacterized protein n=1 Tax=Vibrio zhanjiangensis TaxID=1046128 RepID=A0ABQ6F4M4_9VIBR|nr:hypothetical protein [Vibrio zhanjiangensis]GLT20488.1 hypothetical protein GCM10007938_42730 [Vibrio zhanjiangensis]